VPQVRGVILERGPSLRSQFEHRVGTFPFERFFDFEITGFFKLTDVSRKIAPCEGGLVHDKSEIGAFDYIEQSHYCQPRRFMHQPVKIGQIREIRTVCAVIQTKYPLAAAGSFLGIVQRAQVRAR